MKKNIIDSFKPNHGTVWANLENEQKQKEATMQNGKSLQSKEMDMNSNSKVKVSSRNLKIEQRSSANKDLDESLNSYSSKTLKNIKHTRVKKGQQKKQYVFETHCMNRTKGVFVDFKHTCALNSKNFVEVLHEIMKNYMTNNCVVKH